YMEPVWRYRPHTLPEPRVVSHFGSRWRADGHYRARSLAERTIAYTTFFPARRPPPAVSGHREQCRDDAACNLVCGIAQLKRKADGVDADRVQCPIRRRLPLLSARQHAHGPGVRRGTSSDCRGADLARRAD